MTTLQEYIDRFVYCPDCDTLGMIDLQEEHESVLFCRCRNCGCEFEEYGEDHNA